MLEMIRLFLRICYLTSLCLFIVNCQAGPLVSDKKKTSQLVEVTSIYTPTDIDEITSTPSVTNTPTSTLTPTATSTPKPTQTPTTTHTPSPTSTPTMTNTPKPTNTPTPTNTPISQLAAATPVAGIKDTIKRGFWELTITEVTRQKTLTSWNAKPLNAEGEWVIVFLTLNNISNTSQAVHDFDFVIYLYDGSRAYWVHEYSEARWLYQESRGLSVLLDRGNNYDKKSFPPGIIHTALVYDVSPPNQDLKLAIIGPGNFIDLQN